MALNKALFSSTKDDWETPQSFFDLWDARYDFTLDVCASSKNTKCERFYSRRSNALAQTWQKGERCWMNPPYGRRIGLWTQKAYLAAMRGALVVGLLPSRTDTKWWHRDVQPLIEEPSQGSVHFIKGRLRFVGATASAPFPSVVVVWNPRS